MKRLIAFSLLLSLLLCGCGNSDVANTTGATTIAPTETTTVPTEETTVPTEPPVLYRHPLTGEPLDAPFTGRPVAVSIGNTTAALPQHGISEADIFFEIEAEGGITRFLPIFTDLSEVASIGPIRSARTFFNSVAAAYNAPISHCGGSPRGITGYHDLTGSKIPDWEHIDQFTYGDKYYFRDLDRYNYQGYAWEHCLFITGESLTKALADLKYQNGESWDLGFAFTDEVATEGESATEITVSFLGDKTTDLAYDEATGLYAMRQYNRELIDGTNGEQLAFKNVLVLYAEQSKQRGGSYIRSYYDLIGEGEGYFAVDGKMVKIKWSREDVKKPFVYTLEDGSAVEFGVGKTYIGIADPDSDPIAYK
ncbi:MAG: DUF3048 domain-containing protein [Oscillospiraceae bacterium]|nr:DUF3048 domain-containing protein [Oscillospiraceae bacterium]